jgi:undecaprenyl-diphosphatase
MPVMLPPWFELVEGVCIALVAVLPILRVWPALDRTSRLGDLLRRTWRRRSAPHLLAVVIGASVFFIAAEDTLDRDQHELLSWVDDVTHVASRVVASQPAVRRAAVVVSDATGVGLATAVGTGALCLMVLRRRREALGLAVSTAAAWLASGLLKVAFGVVRPRGSMDYGFPSGHALVAVVGCGLLFWSLARLTSPSPRFGRCYIAAISVALLSGSARIVLDAHWVSDVIAGAALGTVLLSLVVLAMSGSPASTLPPPVLESGGPRGDGEGVHGDAGASRHLTEAGKETR